MACGTARMRQAPRVRTRVVAPSAARRSRFCAADSFGRPEVAPLFFVDDPLDLEWDEDMCEDCCCG